MSRRLRSDRSIPQLIRHPIGPVGAHSAASVGIAFFIITFLHIVLGELARNACPRHAREGEQGDVTPLKLFSQSDVAVDLFFNGTANAFPPVLGIAPASEVQVHSATSWRLLVSKPVLTDSR